LTDIVHAIARTRQHLPIRRSAHRDKRKKSSNRLCRKACCTVDFWDGVLHSERFALLYFDSFRGDATIQLPGLGAQ
jgi:hypothetical protein